jgi:hypothetical protein
MEHSILIAAMAIGIVFLSATAQAKDLRDIELRRLFEPTRAELRQERAGRVYIYDGLKEADIERAMREQFSRLDSMMFIRVKPTPAPPQEDQIEVPTPAYYYQDDGC